MAVVAVVAQASASDLDMLGMAVGGRAFAIIKARWVIVSTDDGGLRLSARNQLHGAVSAVKSGAINAEVAITLPGDAVVMRW